MPLRPPPPPSAPLSTQLSTYGAPHYAPQAGTVPNYPTPAPPVAFRVGAVQAQRANGQAIASLVLGILALIGLCATVGGVLFGLPAVVYGHRALSSIKFSGGTVGGQGMAIAGLIMGYLALAISVIMFCAYVSSPH